jgi:hypothetical protein
MHSHHILLALVACTVSVVYGTPSHPEITPPPRFAKRQDPNASSEASEEAEETTDLAMGDEFTRLASRSSEGLDLTATMVTTLLPEYDGLKASVVATAADPPMIIYPRSPGVLGLGALGVVLYCKHYACNDPGSLALTCNSPSWR